MILLLKNPEKSKELRQNAKDYIDSVSNDEMNTQQMVDNFRAVYEHFNYGTPVPERLIANPEIE